MKIVKAFPPNFPELKRVFKLRGRPGIVYSYGDTIYAPSGTNLPSWIIAHEGAHGARQRAIGVEKWWWEYVYSVPFRLGEEIIGHRAELRKYKEYFSRDNMAATIAGKLSGSLYGNIISYNDALKEITR